MTVKDLTNGAIMMSAMGIAAAVFGTKEEHRAIGILAACIVWFPFLWAKFFGSDFARKPSDGSTIPDSQGRSGVSGP